MVDAIVKELELRSDYLTSSDLESVYLGGGTPSLLTEGQLNRLLDTISRLFKISPNAEITLEANPDDLSGEKLDILANTAINRLSIGVQSFRDEDLLLMNRAHNSGQAFQCLEKATAKGFSNLTIDLIYAVPGLSDEAWHRNLEIAAEFSINHLSCYALTVEPKTLLAHQISRRQIPGISEDEAARQFALLLEFARNQKLIHYEISNFAREGHLAIHNSNYWKQKPYLGVGPSAHSYNGSSRSWNVANNAHYLKAIAEDSLPLTEEILTADQQYNEYVMTGMRTIWGCQISQLEKFGGFYLESFLREIRRFIDQGWVIYEGDKYLLTDTGKLFADHIASELFVVHA